MTDQQTTVLYVLTTLAQSCAALAAFVGAVGVFRLQMLREQRQDAERDLRYWAGQAQVFNSTFVLRVPIKEIIKCLDADREKPTTAMFPMPTRRSMRGGSPRLRSSGHRVPYLSSKDGTSRSSLPR